LVGKLRGVFLYSIAVGWVETIVGVGLGVVDGGVKGVVWG